MRYLVFKAQKKEDKESKKVVWNTLKGELFYGTCIIHDEFYNFLFYEKDGDKFKISYNSENNIDEIFQNDFLYLMKNHLHYTCYNYNDCDLFDFSTILDTEDEEKFLSCLKARNIVPFEEYHASNDIKIVVNNESSFKDDIVSRIAKNQKIFQIKNVSYNQYFSNININKEDLNYINKKYCGTQDFFDWLNGHFIVEKGRTQINFLSINDILNDKKVVKVFNYVFVKEKSIVVDKIEMTILFKDETLFFNFKTKFSYNYTFGEKITCMKKLKKCSKEVSPFDMFNINSSTIQNPEGIYIFDDAHNIQSFFLKHFSFFKKMGLVSFISEMKMNLSLTAIFVIYICLIYEYPVIELLVKMGHFSLIEDIIKRLIQSPTSVSIREQVTCLEQLFEKDATKGSMALRIPSYISNYLKERHANFRDYLFWRDIFEIEHISKENFEKFLNLPERILLNANISGEYGYDLYSLGIQNIIKYDGYSLNKTVKYCFNRVIKHQSANYFFDFAESFRLLEDTLCMAEELDFELEPYPENLKQIHDQLAAIQREKKDEIANEKVQDIAKECSDVMDNVFSSNSADLPTKAMEKLTYVFPESQKDFTQEGQNQNNCVAGYFSRVKSGECIIFFVRKKEDANSSYITAEIKKDGINQVMYSNNRIVPRESMDFKYCKYIANKILKAIDTDKIHAIHKILKD